MDSSEKGSKRFQAVSYQSDSETTVDQGRLISLPKRFSPQSVSLDNKAASLKLAALTPLLFLIPGLMLAVILSFTPLSLPSGGMLAAIGSEWLTAKADTPLVIENPYTGEQTPLNYGIQGIFAEPYFFNETRDSFINAGRTFLEVDLAKMRLRYYEGGNISVQYPILTKAPISSWCETPAGLYQVESKKERNFSNFSQIYQPWSLGFQGNFMIHGTPEVSPGEKVADDYQGGCIRLSDADAKALYKQVAINTPVLVHEEAAPADAFVYQPKIPSLETPHYLIADVESNTILASSDLDAAVPIASLTKLMTALIASEYINLDSSVTVSQPTFVQSLVPRLGDRSRVSMFSLMQLLLIESSNESAEVIAAQLGREDFIKKMNEMAERLGMSDTHFVDPSGLGDGNVSSVRDLFQLTQYIYKHRRFILDLTANQDLPTIYTSGEFGKLLNFNKVESLENFLGGKIGETTAAGQTSVSLHTLRVGDQSRVVAVVILNSKHRNQDVKDLLRYAEERFGR